MATRPTVRCCDYYAPLFYTLEYKWTDDAGEEREHYRHHYASREEAEHTIEQFTKWANYLELWHVEFTDSWIESSISCAHRDRLLWRWVNGKAA